MYLMDFFIDYIPLVRSQGHVQYIGPVGSRQGTAARFSLDGSRGRCKMSLARLRPCFDFCFGQPNSVSLMASMTMSLLISSTF